MSYKNKGVFYSGLDEYYGIMRELKGSLLILLVIKSEF